MQRQFATIAVLPYPSSCVHAEREPSERRRMPAGLTEVSSGQPSEAMPSLRKTHATARRLPVVPWTLTRVAGASTGRRVISNFRSSAQHPVRIGGTVRKTNFLIHPISSSSSPRVHACGLRHGFDAKCQQRHSRLLPTFLREHRLLAGTLAPDTLHSSHTAVKVLIKHR